jgi:hypothetical protein
MMAVAVTIASACGLLVKGALISVIAQYSNSGRFEARCPLATCTITVMIMIAMASLTNFLPELMSVLLRFELGSMIKTFSPAQGAIMFAACTSTGA